MPIKPKYRRYDFKYFIFRLIIITCESCYVQKFTINIFIAPIIIHRAPWIRSGYNLNLNSILCEHLGYLLNPSHFVRSSGREPICDHQYSWHFVLITYGWTCHVFNVLITSNIIDFLVL